MFCLDIKIQGKFNTVEERDAFARDAKALAEKYGGKVTRIPPALYLQITKVGEAPPPAPEPPPAPARTHLSLVPPPVDEEPKAG